MKTSFFSRSELIDFGFQSVGENVLVSCKASIFSPETISIGDNTRIDDYCILSGKIQIGKNVHIAPYSGLFAGEEGIFIEDYANISSRVCIYALSDDFEGYGLTNPTIPDRFKNIKKDRVIIKKHVIIGTGTTVLPGVVFEEGTSIGAMSLVKTSTEEWMVYAGIPAKIIKPRKKEIILKMEQEYQSYLNAMK